MSWQRWADKLRLAPEQAVADLLRGAADISPFDRAAPHEFLLAVLPRDSRNVRAPLLGEPHSIAIETTTDLPAYLDSGLAAWLLTQRDAVKRPPRKLGAYVAQVCEALQWPLYFVLPQSRSALQADRASWLKWVGALTLSPYRDPEYDYWQVLASKQTDDRLQFLWQSFVLEAGRTRSSRYLNLGLLALAGLPLSEDDSTRNLRLQVQALIDRYQRRKSWGTPALEDLADELRGVMTRNPSMNAANYHAFFSALLSPLGEDKTASVLSLLGLAQSKQRYATSIPRGTYELKPPGLTNETDRAVQAVRQSGSVAEAWKVVFRLLSAHENFLRKSGEHYYFVRSLDRCVRALCEKYIIKDPEIQTRVLQWIHLALRVDAENPRLWMLWELALRQTGHPQRSQWVLWDMTRRFPDNLPSRVELARLLAASNTADDLSQAYQLLKQVLLLDPDNLHAHSTLAQLAIRRGNWQEALHHAKQGLRVEPSDAHSAVLLASAYARRNEPDDLQTAVNDLQRFVTRYRGNLVAESYLRVLLKRQQSKAQGEPLADEDDIKRTSTAAAPPEKDPAWRAFADSIRSWAAASLAGNAHVIDTDDLTTSERVLPLPQALRRAVTQNHWDAEVLNYYDSATLNEFPLETRLWRYLQSLQSASSSIPERESARQAIQRWLTAEARLTEQDNPHWVSYLKKQWEAMNVSTETALALGPEWLKTLLDRYQPLPPPLLA